MYLLNIDNETINISKKLAKNGPLIDFTLIGPENNYNYKGQAVVFKDTERNVEINIATKIDKLLLLYDIDCIRLSCALLKNGGIDVELEAWNYNKGQYAINIYSIINKKIKPFSINISVKDKNGNECDTESIEFPLELSPKYEIIKTKRESIGYTTVYAKGKSIIKIIAQRKSDDTLLDMKFRLEADIDDIVEITVSDKVNPPQVYVPSFKVNREVKVITQDDLEIELKPWIVGEFDNKKILDIYIDVLRSLLDYSE